MFIFVIQTLQKKWNEIYMKQLAGGKHMENDCFPRTLKFEMTLTLHPCYHTTSKGSNKESHYIEGPLS
jgi:hypothetical protein